MTIGIDKINFFVPPHFLPMTTLAKGRNEDPQKYLVGIGQDNMAVTEKTQDIITLGANASKKVLENEDLNNLAMIIFATESSTDESKAAAISLHSLLKLPSFVRAIEVKEACYSGTAALMWAKDYIAAHPGKKVLVVTADIARYGLNSGGEVTQGAGSVAMLITENPRILAIESDEVTLTEDIYDFWRPTGENYPRVDGPLSNSTYIEFFGKVFTEYGQKTKKTFQDFTALLFHLPYTKMGKKALLSQLPAEEERLLEKYTLSAQYTRQVGNLYTGSLYLGLISLLDNDSSLKAGDTLGLFSYGSGAVGEFFSGKLVPGFEKQLDTAYHQELLANRKELTMESYEKMFTETLVEEKTYEDPTPFSIKKLAGGIRYYQD